MDASKKGTRHVSAGKVSAGKVVTWVTSGAWKHYVMNASWSARAVRLHALAARVKGSDARLAQLLDDVAASLTACDAAHAALGAYAKIRAEK
jgi:hypothetical protein